MVSKLRFFRLSWLLSLGILVLSACGDPTATPPSSTPTTVPTTAAATTAARTTTVAATTAAPTTAAPTTAIATTAAPTTVAATTVAATTSAPATTAASTTAAATAAVSVDPQKAAAGLTVFHTQCSGCHVKDGKEQGFGPNLSTSQKALDPAYITGNVRNGRGLMPAFTKAEVSDDDLANIIVYLKSIH